MRYVWIAIGVFFLSGCLTRTYTVEKPRVDTTVEGNQGYLFGTPSSSEKTTHLKDTRTISVLEVELGSHPISKEKVQAPQIQAQETVVDEAVTEEEIEENELEPTTEKKYNYYKIEKNDTLQKISQKFYGTTKKWHKLYEENRDVLASPDKVYPGKTIKIPVLEK
ncbi:MAG: LysM peptidoglycan-binding domain-containing protein [Candidatus Omnitrophota bacterium]